jgi:hypothetical protein
MKKQIIILSILSFVVLASAAFTIIKQNAPQADDLTGTWRGKVQFKTGAFAGVKDLEFMLSFNSGGTMTESSNYDGMPPVPPAYGIWRKTGDKQYEAKYEFYITDVPASFEALTKIGGFSPAGYGRIIEKITLSVDGKTYKSKIKFNAFDITGKQMPSNDEADVVASRMEF